MRWACGAWLVLALACGGDEATPKPPGAEGGGGAGGTGGAAPEGCAVGEREIDGLCLPAGVAPEGCADGFEHDGDRGCRAILPTSPCEPGNYAPPGAENCQPVGNCAPGRWGAIPVDGQTQYVDGSYTGMDSDGSADRPWTDVQTALDAASPGSVVAIAAGDYEGDLAIEQPVALWGTCPQEVTLRGDGTSFYALSITAGADGASVQNLTITGASAGVAVAGAVDVRLQDVWIHDVIDSALLATDLWQGEAVPPGEVTLLDALVEAVEGKGLWAYGARLDAERVVIRDFPGPSSAGVSGGIVISSDATTGAKGEGRVVTAAVLRIPDRGVFVTGGDVELEGVLVRDIAAIGPFTGRGLNAQTSSTYENTSFVEARGMVIENTGNVGVYVGGSTLFMEASVIRDIPGSDQSYTGRGLNAQDPDVGEPVSASVTLRDSLITKVRNVGAFASGSSLTIEGSAIIDVAATDDVSVVGGLYGNGVYMREGIFNQQPGALVMRDSVVRDSREYGVVTLSSPLDLEGVLVADTQVSEVAGDGITVYADKLEASGVIRRTRVEGSARAGISAFGAEVVASDVTLACQPLDLDGRDVGGRAFLFVDEGNNACGCPVADGVCKVASTDLAPPAALE